MKLYNKLLLSFLLVPLVTVPSQGKPVTQAAENSLVEEFGIFHDQYMLLQADVIECKNNADYRQRHIGKVYKDVDELKLLIKNQKTIIDPIIKSSSVKNLNDIEASISELEKNITKDIESIKKAKSGWLANPQDEIKGLESLQENLKRLYSKYQDLFSITQQELRSGLSDKGASAAVSSAQSGEYTKEDAEYALSSVERYSDEIKKIRVELEVSGIDPNKINNIMKLVNVINEVKTNKTDLSPKEKLEVAENRQNVKITGTNIEKIILDGIEEQLNSEEGKDEDESTYDDLDELIEENQRELERVKQEKAKAKSKAQRDALEEKQAQLRSQLEEEYKKALEEFPMPKLNQKPSDKQQDLEEELATLEQQSIDKAFMDKVAKNASSWITKLPKGEQVTQDAVRKLLENATYAQVLYANGFLQAMKL